MKTIRALRTEREWTQLDLAYQVKVTPTTVYKWEAGKVVPDIRSLRKLAEVFDVAIEDIALVGLDVDAAGDPLKTAA